MLALNSQNIVVLTVLLTAFGFAQAALPNNIRGVNLGSWLVLEPWMLPEEWRAMGGEDCSDCSKCIRSESALSRAYPADHVTKVFNAHWDTWFERKDVRKLRESGINTVRLPLGFWIVEGLVDSTESFPKGGFRYLRRGLQWLADAGISVILDHHAVPGVGASNQMFAGICTTDVQFYTPFNYHRALVWTAVMTTLSHLDPAFASVEAIEAVNEPLMDASKTPGYGIFQRDFVQTVRIVEEALGVSTPGADSILNNISPLPSLLGDALDFVSGIHSDQSVAVSRAIKSSIPILHVLGEEYNIPTQDNDTIPPAHLHNTFEPLTTTFMDINWQYHNPSNPADAAVGSQIYDNHLYLSFGGVAAANEKAYLTFICNMNRIEKDADEGNYPLIFGEWSLATNFLASDAFLSKWADAQKLAYSQGGGWIYWNFKIEQSASGNATARQWSYMDGLRRGYFTQDPSDYNDPRVCDPYIES